MQVDACEEFEPLRTGQPFRSSGSISNDPTANADTPLPNAEFSLSYHSVIYVSYPLFTER